MHQRYSSSSRVVKALSRWGRLKVTTATPSPVSYCTVRRSISACWQDGAGSGQVGTATARDRPVQEQEQHGADDGADPAHAVVVVEQRPGEQPTDERPGDAEQGGRDQTHRVAAGQEQTGKEAHDEAE